MIEFGEGNLLHAEVDALVNTVNIVGVMGKGVCRLITGLIQSSAIAQDSANLLIVTLGPGDRGLTSDTW